MKHILLSALAVMSMSAFANAGTLDGAYVSLKSGISDTKMKSGTVSTPETTYTTAKDSEIVNPISVALGYDFSQNYNFDVRTELEYTYNSSKTFSPTFESTGFPVLSNKVQSQAIMLNAYYDFKNDSKFTPFVNGGVGLTHLRSKTATIIDLNDTQSESDNHFTWQLGLGVSYELSNQASFEVAYKYVDQGKFELNYGQIDQKFKTSSNDLTFGVRYNF